MFALVLFFKIAPAFHRSRARDLHLRKESFVRDRNVRTIFVGKLKERFSERIREALTKTFKARDAQFLSTPSLSHPLCSRLSLTKFILERTDFRKQRFQSRL